MIEIVGVYGTGGCARGLMPLLRMELNLKSIKLIFIDDAATAGTQVNGHDVMKWPEFLSTDAIKKSVCLGVADPTVRLKLAQRCDKEHIPLKNARAENVFEMDDVIIGEGACLSPFVTLASNIKIGRAFHANIYSYVEHDCRVGDFVTFAPGAKCNGNVHIHDRAYIGANAVIRQGSPQKPLIIGEGAVIGMGAVVTKDVPAGTIVMGNPAAEKRKTSLPR